MKSGPIVAAALLALAGTACSGGADGNAVNAVDGNGAAAGNATATFDPDSEAGRAYRAVLECAATAEYAQGAVGGESMFVEGEARDAMRARETALRATSRALQAVMTAQGTALGLSNEAITEAFNAHQQTLLHGPGMGTRAEHAAAMADRAEACAANYPNAAG